MEDVVETMEAEMGMQGYGMGFTGKAKWNW